MRDNFLKKTLFSFLVNFNILDFLLRIKAINLIAFLSKIFTLNINKTSFQKNYRVLSLGRTIFDEDIRQIAESNFKSNLPINYLRIDKYFFTKTFKYYCPDLMLKHAEYYLSKKNNLYKKNLKKYRKLVKHVLRILSIDAIISANYNYSWQQEIYDVCSEENIKKIILFKEGIAPLTTKSKNRLDSMKSMLLKYTNFNLNANLLLVYNKTVKQAFLESNIADPSLCKVEVSGIPRFDNYTKISKDKYFDSNKIVFFSFSIDSKSEFLNHNQKVRNEISEKADKFHLEVVDFAISNPNIKITIKTKSNPKFFRYVKNLILANYKLIPKNITITNSESVEELIKESKFVIGFNSTTLLQSLIAKRYVLTPNFEEFGIYDIFHDSKDIIFRVENAEMIKKVIFNLCNKSKHIEFDQKFLEEKVGPPDGYSGLRANKLIYQLLDK